LAELSESGSNAVIRGQFAGFRAVTVLIALMAGHLSAEGASAIIECDRLAANRDDPHRTAFGLRFWDIDARSAMAACEAALLEEPNVARLQYQYALALWRAEKYADVLIWLRKAAGQSYPAAQADLGFALARGRGMPAEYRDDAQSAQLIRLAAEQEYSVAMADLAECYMHGRGVRQDFSEALKWLNRAIQQNDRYAQSHFGRMYKNGWGVPQNDTEAVKWFRLSAEQDYRGGQFNLALMYLQGRGVPRDVHAATKLLTRAAEQQLPQAIRMLRELRADDADNAR
jgi:TPR repeat protein